LSERSSPRSVFRLAVAGIVQTFAVCPLWALRMVVLRMD
jgi:hypothetical protein